MNPIQIGLVDDHQLFLKSLSTLIATFAGCTVVLEALNGKSMMDKMTTAGAVPDIMLVDVNMPVVDGFATVRYLSEHYPLVKVAALSMKDDDGSIIGMIKAGCCAYLLKDIHPNELERALHEITEKGFYNADATNLSFRRVMRMSQSDTPPNFTDREKEFIRLACSDLTYKQIAGLMKLSERTVDGYRETLFHKFKVQSRVGLALEAVRRNLASL
jgi:DNA-binding NarL/FixJ family response regulator